MPNRYSTISGIYPEPPGPKYDALNPLVSVQFNDYQLSDLEFSILAIQHITSTGSLYEINNL